MPSVAMPPIPNDDQGHDVHDERDEAKRLIASLHNVCFLRHGNAVRRLRCAVRLLRGSDVGRLRRGGLLSGSILLRCDRRLLGD